MQLIKFGEVINRDSIPKNISNYSINGPVVFERPKFFPNGSKWIMYFAHHNGKGIRVAESDDLLSNWVVNKETIIDIEKIPGYGHIASPEIHLDNDCLELYYHCFYKDSQYTFKAITNDGVNWKYNKDVEGYFYFRLIDKDHAISKFENEGGIWYEKINNKFIIKGKILPKMRHCCYHKNFLYWSEIGDKPEKIYRGLLNKKNFTISNKECIIRPSENYEITKKIEHSKPGLGVGVTELRDPFVIEHENKTYIYYTVRGEEAIAVGEII